MHDSIIQGDGIETTYFYNGDYSGEVVFSAHLSLIGDEDPGPGTVGDYDNYSVRTVEVAVPFEHMKKLVAGWVLNQRISELEQMEDPNEMLGVKNDD